MLPNHVSLPQVFSASQISSPHKALLGLLTRLRATITPFDRSYWPDKGRPRLYLVDWPSQLDSSCSARAIASKPPYI
jgi:hypothetical protein